MLAVVDRMELDPELPAAVDVAAARRVEGGRHVGRVRLVHPPPARQLRAWRSRCMRTRGDSRPGRVCSWRCRPVRPTCPRPWASTRPGSSGATWTRAGQLRSPATGFPDAESARLVPGDLRFARGDLATCCRRRGWHSTPSRSGPISPASSCGGGTDMLRPTQIAIPTLVRVKDGALDRLGIYLVRGGHRKVAVLLSKGLAAPLPERVTRSLKEQSVEPVAWVEVCGQRPGIHGAAVRRSAEGGVRDGRRGRRQGARRGEVRRLPGPAAVLRRADLAVQRRVLQPAVEPDDPRQAAVAAGGAAVRRRRRYRASAAMPRGC